MANLRYKYNKILFVEYEFFITKMFTQAKHIESQNADEYSLLS